MNNLYEFGDFQLHPLQRLLLRDQTAVSISNKAFDLLLVLIEGRDRVLTKDELLEKVWPDTIVEENNLTVAMSALRKALGEGANDRRYILTVPGRGYRFIAEVRTVPAREESPASAIAVSQPAALPEKASNAGKSSRALPSRTLLVLALLAAAVAVVYFALARRSPARQSVQSVHSIAVLPFRMLSAGEDERYMGAGIADALTAKLSKISQLTVRPTGSVLRYGQGNGNPVSAGQELNVDAVLDGQMQRSGSRIRVTVQLVSVRDGATFWTDSTDQDFTNIFAVEDAISAAVSEHLALKLTEAERKVLARHVTQNADAYQAYMKGRYFWDKDTEEPMRKSIQYFQQALDLDPNFALAEVGIADANSELVLQGYAPAAAGFPKVRAAALTALRLDPTLAEPHNSLGVVAWGYDWDWKTAEAEFDRAAELNPESAATHSNRAFYLMTMKRFDQSIAEAKRAVALNPASASLNTTVGYAYFAAQRYGDSAVWLQKALDLDPDFSFPRALLTVDHALGWHRDQTQTDYARISDFARSGKDPLVSAMAAYACAVSGDRKDALDILTHLNHPPAQRYVDPYAIAVVYSGLGNDAAALDWLERAFREHSLSVVFFNFDPFLLKYHSNPRFTALVQQSGTPN